MRISGVVKRSVGRGKQLGFPTANLNVDPEMEEGIYAGFCTIIPERSRRASLIFVGAAETFGESEKRIEIYILDFEGDLYDKELRVELIEKIRDNQKFESEADLIRQMKEDERAARDFFARRRA